MIPMEPQVAATERSAMRPVVIFSAAQRTVDTAAVHMLAKGGV
jgi:hypothetical protein